MSPAARRLIAENPVKFKLLFCLLIERLGFLEISGRVDVEENIFVIDIGEILTIYDFDANFGKKTSDL